MSFGVVPQHKCSLRRSFRFRRSNVVANRLCNRQTYSKAFIEEKAPGGMALVGGNHSAGPERSLMILDYNDLAKGKDMSSEIEKALGPEGLGALAIANVPGYPSRRRRLLPLADVFATLPDEVKARYEDPESYFNFGWSHGKEYLIDGQRDTHKGSFYANPLADDLLLPSEGDARQPWRHRALHQDGTRTAAGTDVEAAQPRCRDAGEEAALRRRHPGYYRPNLWPRDELPELEGAFKDLGRLVCAVGCLLAEHCDSYVSTRLGTPRGQLSGVLHRSLNPKARLLHYFAASAEELAGAEADELPGCEHQQPWCGWHTDHGSLTGLTSAMYIDAAGKEVPCPDPSAGLYIRDRHGRIVRAVIPPDCVAFQVGEAMQVHSGGLLMATPHYVRAARGPAAAGISRNTFAVFMQPNVEEPMDCPQGVEPQRVEVGQWRPGVNFGEFAEATFRLYYPKA